MSYKKDEAYIDADYYQGKIGDKYPLAIMLPHSCDEWIIGNVEDAKNLIDDLTKLIEELEGGATNA